MKILRISLWLLILFSIAVQAEEPLVTDRPDVAESAVTVGKNRTQIETGVTYTRDNGVDQTTFPTLLRIGIERNWELRIESDTLTIQNPGPNHFSDVSLGAKVNLLNAEDTKVGLLFNLNLPVGPRSTRGTFDPSLAVLWDQALVGELGLGVNAGVALPEDQGTRYINYFWATSLSHPVTEDLTAYLEYYGEGPVVLNGSVQTAVDGGFTYLLNDNTQLDLSYAKGLSNGGFDWSVGLGFSNRF